MKGVQIYHFTIHLKQKIVTNLHVLYKATLINNKNQDNENKNNAND